MRGIAKKMIAVTATATLALGLGACSSERGGASSQSGATGAGGQGGLIGVSMPTKSLERWNRDGGHLEELLKEEGYSV